MCKLIRARSRHFSISWRIGGQVMDSHNITQNIKKNKVSFPEFKNTIGVLVEQTVSVLTN